MEKCIQPLPKDISGSSEASEEGNSPTSTCLCSRLRIRSGFHHLPAPIMSQRATCTRGSVQAHFSRHHPGIQMWNNRNSMSNIFFLCTSVLPADGQMLGLHAHWKPEWVLPLAFHAKGVMFHSGAWTHSGYPWLSLFELKAAMACCRWVYIFRSAGNLSWRERLLPAY